MNAPRFYHPHALDEDTVAILDPDAAHHATRVLRLRIGDPLVLFNGEGGEYACTVQTIDKRNVSVAVVSWNVSDRESPLDITLVQAIASVDKMDLVLQKSVELGVHRIVVVESARAVVRLDRERARKRMERWRQIVISACEQCGRNHLPELVPEVLPLGQWLGGLEEGTRRWMLSPHAEVTLREAERPQGEIQLLIGPEGGFTDQEYAQAQAQGFTAVRLGARVLRTETAGLAALAAMQALWGDF